MRAIRYGWMLMVLAPGCMPAGADFGGMSGGQPVIGEDMVPDPQYHPKIGDRALLYGIENGGVLDRLPLLKDVTAYDIFVRSQQTHDAERLAELEQQGWLQWAAPGTRVTILAMQDRTHTGASMATQVRMIDSTQKSQAFWSSSDYINRLIRKEPE